MHTVVLVSPRVDEWKDLVRVLKDDGRFSTVSVRNGADALEAAAAQAPLAMVIDEGLDDISGIELTTRLLHVNAMINVALASGRPQETFHEETEGLGLLMQLSPLPTTAEAGELVNALLQLTGGK
jgi:CheY-like chemotaxis protein